MCSPPFPFPCHKDAECLSTKLNYTCTCKPGFTGDGHNCTGTEHPKLCYERQQTYTLTRLDCLSCRYRRVCGAHGLWECQVWVQEQAWLVWVLLQISKHQGHRRLRYVHTYTKLKPEVYMHSGKRHKCDSMESPKWWCLASGDFERLNWHHLSSFKRHLYFKVHTQIQRAHYKVRGCQHHDVGLLIDLRFMKNFSFTFLKYCRASSKPHLRNHTPPDQIGAAQKSSRVSPDVRAKSTVGVEGKSSWKDRMW